MTRPAAGAVEQALQGRRATWIEVDLQVLAANARALHQACGERPFWAVVKADGYGHGAAASAGALALERGCAGLVVALSDEGAALRRAGITAPVLLFGPAPPDGWGAVLRDHLIPSLSRREDLETLEQAAASAGRICGYHLELDTGMSRMGLDPAELDGFLETAAAARWTRMEGVFSHLASIADPVGARAVAQERQFAGLVRRIRASRGDDVQTHLAASPAICGSSGAVPADAVRPGILLYGLPPVPGMDLPDGVRPALAFRTTLNLIRDVPARTAVGYDALHVTREPVRIGVGSAGYADGLRKDLAGAAYGLLRGSRAGYVGAVNMDLVQVEIPRAVPAAAGDVLTLIGTDGDERVGVDDLARLTGRSVYEWVTGLGARVPRVLHRGGKVERVYVPTEGW